MRSYENEIVLYCEASDYTNIALVCSGLHYDLIDSLKRIARVDCYDRDPFLPYEYYHKDVIFDECDFYQYDLIINLSAEKMYPMPQVHPGYYLQVISVATHSRDCTNIDSHHGMIIEDRIMRGGKYIIIGPSISHNLSTNPL